MSGNPFAITSEDLIKKQQGAQAAGKDSGVQKATQSKEAQETEKLKSTDVYSYAGANGGSMATTDGVFENYDGFTRSSATVCTTSGDKECQGATSDAKDAQSDAGNAKKKADNAANQAEDDKKQLTSLSKQSKTKEKQATTTVTRNNGVIDEKLDENNTLESEINDANAEIAALMAEDGQQYTPAPVATADIAAPPQAAPQAQGNGGAQQPAVTADGGQGANADTGAGMNAGAGDGANAFAMLSLPTAGAEAAPTSETAVSAQNNASGGAQTQGAQNKGQNQQQNAPATRSAAGASSSSLTSFGAAMPEAKGKNADRIKQLQGEVADKTSTTGFNVNTILSMRNSNNSLLSSTMAFSNNVKSTASAKKASNQAGFNVAQAAQTTGAVTTTTGGVITGIAQMKIAAPDPTGATKAAGLALLPYGIGTTAAGTATTTAATFAQGKTTEGIQQAGSSFTQVSSSIANLKNLKSS